jgi:hypothetical protein
MSNTYSQRDAVIEYLRQTLFGPIDGPSEVLDGTPLLRYMTGLLFPAGIKIGEAEDGLTASAEDDGAIREGEEEEDRPERGLDLTTEALPSTVGISFCLPDSAQIRCVVTAAVYEAKESVGRRRSAARWTRRSLDGADGPTTVSIDKANAKRPQTLWGGLAQLKVRWRTRADGSAIVTVALMNVQDRLGRGPDPSTTLFQVGLRCEAPGGTILEYPEVDAIHAEDSEEREVAFLYREEAVFARGHGAAATWGDSIEGACGWVAVEFIPAVDVPPASFVVDDADIDPRYCSIEMLTTAARNEVTRSLDSLVRVYGKWVDDRVARAQGDEKPAIARELATRAVYWLERMRRGVQLLRTDEMAWRCFRLANEAMAIQMALVKARPKVPHARTKRQPRPSLGAAGRQWRPFQIAFLLATIESLMDPNSTERDVADVIWFPTGGGKTEAYLLVSAFELVRRRLVHGSADTATAIISRYTLRFLTAQQFQRTAALVVALEIMRRKPEIGLGDRQFTLGLWVGGAFTPNDLRTAHEQFEAQAISRQPENKFQLQACPCCGTAIFPARPGNRRDFGVVATLNEFSFYCPNDACEFHSGLPLNVVDQALYQSPPSILLGTIDKFAQLPWDERARTFFGGPDDMSPPPSLILQDELHLIAGPLGTLAAPYDAAIDTVIKIRGGHSKRICSTATIRNAREQVRGLYGRRAAVFPPPCDGWDDAFFFRTERSKPGRTYVGVMGQGYIKPVVAMAWTSAAMLQAVKELPLDPATLDAYWTLLAYHNSRRELGRTLSAARDEIQARVQAIASSPAHARVIGEPLELSAQTTRSLGEALEMLEAPHSGSRPAVDIVPCTSIISVGVDLDRLGIMLVNGQPKLTSEYIQASSRVGRASIPGLVVSLFSATKPRDRSHYEDFRAFHESLYRHVEPTSVTPYALPARERTLHAALVAVIRHATAYAANTLAKAFDSKASLVRAAVAELERVMVASDPTEAAEIIALLRNRVAEWEQEASSGGQALLYERRSAGMAFNSLLAEYGTASFGALWPTMNSVRNVDGEVNLRLL